MERLLEVSEQSGIQRFIVDTDGKDMEKVLGFYRLHGFRLWYARMF
jgi:hypothetical protein